MLQFDYMLETLAPVCFTEQSGDNVLYATKQYIPGAAVRGALAALYIKEHNVKDAHKDTMFRKLFLSGEVRYLPAYPRGNNGSEAIPAPLSIMVSKDGKTIADFSNGTVTQAGFKKLSGFTAIDTKKKTLSSVVPDVQIEFHMSRADEAERISGSSIKGSVFNYEYLEPFQEFCGRILLDDSCGEEVKSELKKLLKSRLSLGRSRSSQYGSCSCKIINEHSVEMTKQIPKQLILLAHTAYIPEEDWSRTDALAQVLADELNVALAEGGSDVRLSAEDNQIFAAVDSIDGFVGVWGLKRERKNALAAGSLVELKANKLDEKALELIQNRLYAGCGERIAEGFGFFTLWTPLEDGYTRVDKSKFAQDKVDLSAVKDDALSILRSRILDEIRNYARNNAASMTISAKGKGTLKRVEVLTDSDKSKAEIQEKINGFRKTAKANLFGMRLKGEPLLHCILEQENVAQPYANINWLSRLGLSNDMAKTLKTELGISENLVSEDDLFKEYWLWFARHGVKGIKKQDSRRNKAFTIGGIVESKE